MPWCATPPTAWCPTACAPRGTSRPATWLEAAGESEPLVLAEHYKLGGQKQKAIHFFTRACKQICERQRTDLHGAQRCLEAALDCGPTGPALTELQVLEADISFWMEDFARTIAVSERAPPEADRGERLLDPGGGQPHPDERARADAPRRRGRWATACWGSSPLPRPSASTVKRSPSLAPSTNGPATGASPWPCCERMAQVTQERLERDATSPTAGGTVGQGTDRVLLRCPSLAVPGDGRGAMEAFGKVGADRTSWHPRTLLGQVLAALGDVLQGRRR